MKARGENPTFLQGVNSASGAADSVLEGPRSKAHSHGHHRNLFFSVSMIAMRSQRFAYFLIVPLPLICVVSCCVVRYASSSSVLINGSQSATKT